VSYKVVEWLRILEFGMPIARSINTKAARILGVALLITAALTLAGCASTAFTDSRTTQNNGISEDMPDSKSDNRPGADECHVLRDAFLDPARMSVNIFSLFGLPVVFIRDANCAQ
jgi:hypothetical protein